MFHKNSQNINLHITPLNLDPKKKQQKMITKIPLTLIARDDYQMVSTNSNFYGNMIKIGIGMLF
jgi:hypothetical protein